MLGRAHRQDPLLPYRGAVVTISEEEYRARALEIERQHLQAAMAESLNENETRKAAERPLHEWIDQDLLDRYKASCILREVTIDGTMKILR